MEAEKIREIEIKLLLDALYFRYGYDFRNYDRLSLDRRIGKCLETCSFTHISEIIPRLLYQGEFLNRLVHALAVNTTEMFRDPLTFAALRVNVFPILESYPFINIWHAGCASGEEVYSMAILLHEAGLLDKTRLYATDIDEEILLRAREGIYSADRLELFEDNYRRAGGNRHLSAYFSSGYGLFRMDERLRENMIFANHNLVTDGIFAEIHLLLCRNVLIYFDATLREHTLRLFHDSLTRGGFLCLGSSESLLLSGMEDRFAPVSARERLFRKKGVPLETV